MGRLRSLGLNVQIWTERIEAFSDGVFAIAITLLILLNLWPSYFAYVLSFVMIGIYWANHHYVFKLYEKTNLAILPLPTEVLGEYMLDRANQTTAATFYAIGLLLPAASWLLMWLYATRGHRLVDRRLDAGYLRRLTLQYTGSVALYSGAVVVSLIDFRYGLGICVGLTLLYLLPPKSLVYREGG